MEVFKIQKLLLKNEELAFKLLNHVLKLEQVHGPREYWFRRGLVTATSIAVFVAVPQYRVVTGAWALLNVADSVAGMGLIKWAEEYIRKQQKDFIKKYPNPQALIEDLSNNDKKDLH